MKASGVGVRYLGGHSLCGKPWFWVQYIYIYIYTNLCVSVEELLWNPWHVLQGQYCCSQKTMSAWEDVHKTLGTQTLRHIE